MQTKGSISERLIVTALCFGFLIVNSTFSVIAGLHEFDYTNARVAEMLTFEVVVGVVMLRFLKRRGWVAEDVSFNMSRRSTGAGVLLFLANFFVYSLTYSVIHAAGLLQHWPVPKVTQSGSTALVLLFVIVNSFFEEGFVAAYLVESWQRSRAALAISISAAVRLLYHTYQGPVALAAILPMGLLFAYVYWRWRNLWPLVVAHTIQNVLIVLSA